MTHHSASAAERQRIKSLSDAMDAARQDGQQLPDKIVIELDAYNLLYCAVLHARTYLQKR